MSLSVLTILNMSKILLTDKAKYSYFPCVTKNQRPLYEAPKHQVNEDAKKMAIMAKLRVSKSLILQNAS